MILCFENGQYKASGTIVLKDEADFDRLMGLLKPEFEIDDVVKHPKEESIYIVKSKNEDFYTLRDAQGSYHKILKTTPLVKVGRGKGKFIPSKIELEATKLAVNDVVKYVDNTPSIYIVVRVEGDSCVLKSEGGLMHSCPTNKLVKVGVGRFVESDISVQP